MNIAQIIELVKGRSNVEWIAHQQNRQAIELERSLLRHPTSRDIPRVRYTQGDVAETSLLLLDHHGQSTGEVTITVGPSTTDVDITNALTNAAAINNPSYRLARAQPMTLIQLAGDIGREDVEAAMDQIHSICARDRKVRVAKATVNLTRTDSYVTSSNNHDVQFATSDAYVEVLLLYDADSPNSSFGMFETYARDIESLGLERKLENALEQLRGQKSGKGFDEYEGPIVLVGDAARDFFVGGVFTASPFLYHSDASQRYQLTSPLQLESPFTTGQIVGDKVRITSDPFVNGALGSYHLTKYGLVPKPVVLVEDSKLVGVSADIQHATYLGVEPTGPVGNVVVDTGSTAMKNMITEGCPVVTTFASFKCSPEQETIDTKAQTGYVVRGGSRESRNAGVVHLNYGDALAQITLSEELQQNGRYVGPLAIRIERAKID